MGSTHVPVMPADMDEAAQAVWRRGIGTGGAMLTEADSDALRVYCEAVARYEEAAKKLAESGALIRGGHGGALTRNPLHQLVRDNATLMREQARELDRLRRSRRSRGPRVGYGLDRKAVTK